MPAAITCFFNDVRETNAIASRYFSGSTLPNFLSINCGEHCEVVLRHSGGYPLRRHGKFDGFAKGRKRRREMPSIITRGIHTVIVKWNNSKMETNCSWRSYMNTKIRTQTQIGALGADTL